MLVHSAHLVKSFPFSQNSGPVERNPARDAWWLEVTGLLSPESRLCHLLPCLLNLWSHHCETHVILHSTENEKGCLLRSDRSSGTTDVSPGGSMSCSTWDSGISAGRCPVFNCRQRMVANVCRQERAGHVSTPYLSSPTYGRCCGRSWGPTSE